MRQPEPGDLYIFCIPWHVMSESRYPFLVIAAAPVETRNIRYKPGDREGVMSQVDLTILTEGSVKMTCFRETEIEFVCDAAGNRDETA